MFFSACVSCGACRIRVVFFFKQKTAYEMRISDWSSDVCSSDLARASCADGALHPAGSNGMIGEWLDIGWVDDIPVRGSRTVQVAGGDDIAVFRTAEGKVFALLDRCPPQHGRLSQGIVHGGAELGSAWWRDIVCQYVYVPEALY